ncbi:MAG TPA: aminoglycoside phosphotransferase family protein [Nocardioidaceae bacterium]|nr:aminoglycoside phosphotransferase family protein [Nocardioidaceae bacterium]
MALIALPFAIPAGLLKQAELGPDWADWLDRLPGLYRAMVSDWELTCDGAPLHGFVSLVVPVRTRSARPAMLKLTFDGDDESVHEGLALQRWSGSGTVRLLRHDPRRRALLLERLHPEDLNAVPVIDACELVAGLYRRLHIPAFAQLRTVESYVGRWLDELAELPRNAPIPRRLVEQAEAVGRPLISDTSGAAVVVHGDLHYENVLAGDREPWLVIDPKPMSGDPHYEPAPMLWNRWDEVVATGNVRSAVRHRFHTLVDTAELDEDRARDWVVVRMVINAHWSIQDAQRAQRDLRADERAWITECIAIAKAVQD